MYPPGLEAEMALSEPADARAAWETSAAPGHRGSRWLTRWLKMGVSIAMEVPKMDDL